MKELLKRIMHRIQILISSSRRRHELVGPAHLWRLKRSFQIQVLRDLGLSPEQRLLDIGCGTLRGGVPIIRYLDSGRYCGVDVRPEVLKEARLELQQHALRDKRPLLIAADITEFALRRRFDIVWAFSVFIHLPDEKLEQCFAFVANHLAPRGRCLGNVNIGTQADSSWREFPVVARPASYYRNAAAEVGLEVTDLGSLRKLGHESGRDAQDNQRLLRLERND